MEIAIKGEPKEIADFVLELQRRQLDSQTGKAITKEEWDISQKNIKTSV